MSEFKGPQQRYIVRLFEGDALKKIENITLRRVVFEHLSYSTNYRVQVGTGHPRIISSLNQCFQRFSVPPVDHI